MNSHLQLERSAPDFKDYKSNHKDNNNDDYKSNYKDNNNNNNNDDYKDEDNYNTSHCSVSFTEKKKLFKFCQNNK